MSHDSQRASVASSAECVDLRITLTSQVAHFNIRDRRQVAQRIHLCEVRESTRDEDCFLGLLIRGRSLDNTLFFVSDRLETVQHVVALLTRSEQVSVSQDAERYRCRNRVEVLQCQTVHILTSVVQHQLEEITQLRLKKEEEEILLLVEAVGVDHDFADTKSSGELALAFRLGSFVDEEVFTDNDDSSRSFWCGRDGEKEMCGLWNAFRRLLDDVVETEVEFVDGEILDDLAGVDSGIFGFHLAVVAFDACELRVLVAYIQTAHVVAECVRFVRFQG